jgi:hypothetical protein
MPSSTRSTDISIVIRIASFPRRTSISIDTLKSPRGTPESHGTFQNLRIHHHGIIIVVFVGVTVD